jgi:hypothetical protein
MENQEYIKKRKSELVDFAKQTLTAELSITDGTLKILPILNELEISNLDEYIIFVLFESETDHLPRGIYKRNWNPIVLKEKEKELEKAENFYRNDVIEACKTILKNFKG